MTVLDSGEAGRSVSLGLICVGGLPLFVAFWAVLLAYLVPEKPQRSEPREQAPLRED